MEQRVGTLLCSLWLGDCECDGRQEFRRATPCRTSA